jgi:hypothetical protein
MYFLSHFTTSRKPSIFLWHRGTPKPGLMFSGLTSHSHYHVTFQTNVLSEPSETRLPILESQDNTEKEHQELWAFARRGPVVNGRPRRNSANINPSVSNGFSPTSNNKEELSSVPTMLSHRYSRTRALEAHIHPRGGVSRGISHTCQWIAHNSCTDTSELLVLGYNLPGSKLCNFCCFQANWKELKLAND